MAGDEELLVNDEPADVNFWNKQLDKVLKSLKEGLESAVVQDPTHKDWEAPAQRAKALQIALKRQQICPYCGETSAEFSGVMLHVLEKHLFYGQDLLSTLKNGHHISRIR